MEKCKYIPSSRYAYSVQGSRMIQNLTVFSSCQFGGNGDDLERDTISIEEANHPMPLPKDGFTFDSLIRTREEVQHFKEFLTKKHGKGGYA